MLPYAPWLVWAIPCVGSVLAIPLSKIPSLRNWFAFGIGILSAAYALSMVPDVLSGTHLDLSVPWLPIFNLKAGVIVDPLSVFMACAVSFVGSWIVLYSQGYMAGEEGLARYYFLMLLFIGAMIGLVMSNNFFQLYINWEIVGLCSYALIGFWYKRPEAARAGVKAFVVTRIGDIGLLIGIILLYRYTGTLMFSELKAGIGELSKTSLLLIMFLMLSGAVGKSAQVPLHVWLPDAMEGPTTVSALIHAATMVKAGVYLVARIIVLFGLLESPAIDWTLTVAWIGAVTAFLAASMALVSFDMKRVLAYSTVSQIGYMMLGLGLGTYLGYIAGVFHLMSHAVFKGLLFLGCGAVLHATGTRDMRQMGGLRTEMPITFATFTIGALALAGLPPLNGFWSKELVFRASLIAGQPILFVISVITAVMTFAYSIRMLGMVFLYPKSDYVKQIHVHEAPWVMTVPLIILSAVTLFAGFLESPFEIFFSSIVNGHTEVGAFDSMLAYGGTAAALAFGGYPAYLIYIKRKISPEVVTRSVFGTGLYKLVSEGYYFDKLYEGLVVRGTYGLSNLLNWFDIRILDGLVNGISGTGSQISTSIRRIQSGVTQQYVAVFVAGIVFLALLISIVL